MNVTTRNVLILLLVLMTGGMYLGFSQGSTPEIKALLALMYGLFAGMAVCIALLVILPAFELARKSMEARNEQQPQG